MFQSNVEMRYLFAERMSSSSEAWAGARWNESMTGVTVLHTTVLQCNTRDLSTASMQQGIYSPKGGGARGSPIAGSGGRGDPHIVKKDGGKLLRALEMVVAAKPMLNRV
jgi:hypothetical protein